MADKVLITGGAGFIGSHVVDIFLREGYEVVIVDNLSSGKMENLNSGAKFYKMDITGELGEIFEKEKPDYVVHSAAQTQLRSSLEDPLGDANANIFGTLNLLNNCRRFSVKKLIHFSTGGARYGEPKYLPVDESHPLNPCSPYGISKVTAERYVKLYGELFGLNYIILCFGNVYGPRDVPENKRVIPVFIDKMMKNESPMVFGSGEQTRDFIYVKDLAEFAFKCLKAEHKSRIFNLADGKKVSVNEIVLELKNLLDFKKDIIYSEGIKGEIKDIVLDNSLVIKELQWAPKYDIKEGLKETVDWFVKRGR